VVGGVRSEAERDAALLWILQRGCEQTEDQSYNVAALAKFQGLGSYGRAREIG
jgi:hypothetical protein